MNHLCDANPSFTQEPHRRGPGNQRSRSLPVTTGFLWSSDVLCDSLLRSIKSHASGPESQDYLAVGMTAELDRYAQS